MNARSNFLWLLFLISGDIRSFLTELFCGFRGHCWVKDEVFISSMDDYSLVKKCRNCGKETLI